MNRFTIDGDRDLYIRHGLTIKDCDGLEGGRYLGRNNPGRRGKCNRIGQDQTTKDITVEAYKITENLLCHHIGGGSIFEGMGIYTHENGQIVRERSLSVKTSTDNHQAVLDFVGAVKAALNQESVYMQQMEVSVSFI